MQHWEYKMVDSYGGREVTGIDHEKVNQKPLPKVLDYLNQLGREGWEVVGFASHSGVNEYVLKRPLLYEG